MGKLSFFKIVITIDKKFLTEGFGFSRLFENGNVKSRTKIWVERKKSRLMSGQLARKADMRKATKKLLTLQNMIFFHSTSIDLRVNGGHAIYIRQKC